MPASFRTLPPEVLTQIISNIEKSGWLLDLALCCCSLYHLTLPCLYSNVTLNFYDHKTGLPYLKPFTIHILKNPELASLVRGFTMDKYPRDDSISFENTGSQGIDEAIQEIVSRSSFPREEQDKLIGSLEKGDAGSYLALLLSSLPNLKTLDLMVPALSTDYYEGFIRSAAKRENLFHTQPAFSSLRVVIHDWKEHKFRASPGLLSIYVRLPSLRKLYCQNIGSYQDEANKGLATLEPATVPLHHLEIRKSSFNEIDLTNILRASKDLKTFVYESDRNRDWRYRSVLVKTLTWTENCLENLWLDYDGNYLYDRGEEFSPMGNLPSFKVLKNLRVGMYVFFSIPGGYTTWVGPVVRNGKPDLRLLLPASIETIYFSRTRGRVNELTDALEELLQAKESYTPKLRRIAFEADVTGQDKAFDYSRLDFLAKEAKVEIVKIDVKGKWAAEVTED